MPSLAESVAPPFAQSRAILIVDDHVDSADVIATALELHGHDARAAYDPLGALALVREFRAEIAILDVDLPTMDGYELGAALGEELPECRFIALTGNASGLTRLRSQWAGFHGYLTKPVGLEDLLLAVAETRPSGVYSQQTERSIFPRELLYRRQRERARIDLEQSQEVVRYWTTALGCTEAQLRAAVSEVGINADDVRRQLKK
ncbi:MAG TPA: response regulator [Polyangiaceae bacterium]